MRKTGRKNTKRNVLAMKLKCFYMRVEIQDMPRT